MLQNELYLGPSTDVSRENPLGSAALDMVLGAPNTGHTRKINLNDYNALLVAYIILNNESVGLFIYDADDGSQVHHQFMSSRVERCLLAHATELAAPFIPAAHPTLSMGYLPDVLLASVLSNLTATQRLYQKIRAIRMMAPIPTFAMRSHGSGDVIVVRLPEEQNNPDDRLRIEATDHFISWLADASDEHIARVVDNCDLSERPRPLKAWFKTPNVVSSSTLNVLDEFDVYSDAVSAEYAKIYDVSIEVAHQRVTSTDVRHLIDRGLIHHVSPSAVVRTF